MLMEDPLIWTVAPPSVGDIYPYRVKPNRYIYEQNVREMEEFCNNMFGVGGHMPSPGSRWFNGVDSNRDWFSFRNETDMTMFVVAFSG